MKEGVLFYYEGNTIHVYMPKDSGQKENPLTMRQLGAIVHITRMGYEIKEDTHENLGKNKFARKIIFQRSE
jgi:hypothetical protein